MTHAGNSNCTVKEMWNFECSTVVIVTPLVLMKDKVGKLSNLGLKAFAIGTGNEEVFAEGASLVDDRTVGESFGVCCPGVISNFLPLKS